MQHTLAQLRTLQASLLSFDLDNFAGNSAGTVSDADRNRQINMAYQILARRLKIYDPKVTLTLYADDDVIDLRVTTGSTNNKVSKRVWKAEYVIIGGNPLLDASGKEYGLWSMDELERECPGWRTASSGTPSIAAYYTSTKIRLYPKPSAAGSNNFVSGLVIPADLSADADVPDIPEEIHEVIAFLAAVFASSPMASENEAWARLQKYEGGFWMRLVDEIAQQNENLLQTWGSTYDVHDASLMEL